MNFKLSPEQISENWDIFLSNIDTHISEPRRSQLREFYLKYQERIMMMPASHKKDITPLFQEDTLTMLIE